MWVWGLNGGWIGDEAEGGLEWLGVRIDPLVVSFYRDRCQEIS